jgi:prohibitin 1
VPGGHRAVIFSRSGGIKLGVVKEEGINWIIPFWQWPQIFDVRITPQTIRTETPTKDLQRVNIALRVLYRPGDNLPMLYKNYGTDYAQRVLPGIGQEVLKAVVAQYHPDTLITQRAQVSKAIKDDLTKRAKDYFIDLEDVAITDLSFGPEFSQAIERKQVEQQEAERAKYIVQKTEQERKAAVIRAEGEAEAARLITQATSEFGSTLVELRRIEAAKEVAQVLSESPNITYLPSGYTPQLMMQVGLPRGSKQQNVNNS